MSLGRMRETLRLLSKTTASDGGGGRTVTWSTLDTVPAEELPVTAKERMTTAAKLESIVERRFRIRTRGDVVPTMRIEWRPRRLGLAAPRVFEVTGVRPDRLSPASFLLLDCSTVAAASPPMTGWKFGVAGAGEFEQETELM